VEVSNDDSIGRAEGRRRQRAEEGRGQKKAEGRRRQRAEEGRGQKKAEGERGQRAEG
jgi:hypothetical protein